MSSLRGATIGFILLISLVFLMLVLKVFNLNAGLKAVNTTLLLLVIFTIVALLTALYIVPYKTLTGSEFIVNLHNYDPVLQYVVVTTSPTSQVQVPQGETVYAIPLTALQTISAVGYGTGTQNIPYAMSTTFTNITSPDLYFTVGGIQTSSTYLSVSVNNGTTSPFTFYTKDLNNSIIPYITVSTGTSAIYVYVGQYVQDANGNGAIVTNSSVKEIDIDFTGAIDITSNLSSGQLAFTNGTGNNGVLEHRDPWEIGAVWEPATNINKGDTSSSLTVYVTQEWRLVNGGVQLSPIVSISEDDIQSGNDVVLEGFSNP